MKVWVDKPKCTGCAHCHDVCPVAVFEMKDSNAPDVNSDVAPAEQQWKGQEDPSVYAKWKDVQDGHNHFKEKSVAVNGEACILCQACLIECEGECIHIVDDNNTQYDSIYK
ncbi:MAG: ferredoxin family protein [Candidatus Marsarchaeota archaeon]|jgi:NAD-dependent dihydropyrimidine dehydrogenase PreA subunit|nr:ferredoxin family protein [Candidatus Marsarchaeota archaeon]MCL5112827.1 ferredoxin family protein [Candidatus Marsarchaeota archaeon]